MPYLYNKRGFSPVDIQNIHKFKLTHHLSRILLILLQWSKSPGQQFRAGNRSRFEWNTVINGWYPFNMEIAWKHCFWTFARINWVFDKTRRCQCFFIEQNRLRQHFHNLEHRRPSISCCLDAKEGHLNVSKDFIFRKFFEVRIHQFFQSSFLKKLPSLKTNLFPIK